MRAWGCFFFSLLSANRWCRQQEMHMQYVSWHCKFFQLFPLSSWLIYGGDENINKYERGEETKVLINLSHTKNTAIKTDRKQQQHAMCFFSACERKCVPNMPPLLSARFLRSLPANRNAPNTYFLSDSSRKFIYSLPHIFGSSAHLLVRWFCLASSEECDLTISTFFAAIGREFHSFCNCNQIC